jgi:hypothetical protein
MPSIRVTASVPSLARDARMASSIAKGVRRNSAIILKVIYRMHYGILIGFGVGMYKRPDSGQRTTGQGTDMPICYGKMRRVRVK